MQMVWMTQSQRTEMMCQTLFRTACLHIGQCEMLQVETGIEPGEMPICTLPSCGLVRSFFFFFQLAPGTIGRASSPFLVKGLHAALFRHMICSNPGDWFKLKHARSGCGFPGSRLIGQFRVMELPCLNSGSTVKFQIQRRNSLLKLRPVLFCPYSTCMVIRYHPAVFLQLTIAALPEKPRD